MADTPNPAPAGADGPISHAPTVSILDAMGDEDFGKTPASEDEGEDVETEPAEIDPAPEPEGKGEDEDDGSEDEGPEGDASEPEPKEAASDDEETGTRMHRLRDGSQVSLGDLKKGYDRAREFERALPQIQQERARFEQERQQFTASQQQIQPILANVANVLQSQLPPEPDASLLSTDPIEFFTQKQHREVAMARLQQVNQAHAQQQQAEQARQAEERKIYLAGEQQKLVQALPELRDAEKAKAFNADFQKVGAAVGFTPEELGQVFDHRLFKLVKLAARGQAAIEAEGKAQQTQATKAAVAAKKVVDKPPVQAPAARQNPAVREGAVARGSLEKLRKTGSTAAAEDFLSRFE